MSSRRAEAHQRLTEREEISVADAKQRVADATAEAETRVREATEQAAELVRRAAAESHQRVAEADAAVGELTALRGHVLDQLASLRDHLAQVDKLAATAPTLLDPSSSEASRPVTSDFPVDPAGRPTGLPDSYDKAPGPWDEVTVETVRADLGQPQPDQHRQPLQRSGNDATEGSNDPAMQALSDQFASSSDVPRDVSESDTDTFPRVTDSAESQNSQADTTVPAQQRKGMRAFAERAIGGR
jgi:hypothetical protein